MTRKQRKNLIRIIISIVLFAAMFFIPINGIASSIFDTDTGDIARMCCFAAIYAVIGYDIVIKAFKGLFGGQFLDENFLMTIAAVGAFILGDYSEGAAVMIFYQVGELFQSLAVSKSRKSISALMDIRPDSADVERDGVIETVDPEEVEIGEIIVIKPGDKIPLDCVIEDGETSVDTSSVTGESVPRTAGVGDSLISGCVNLSGVVRCRTTTAFGDSTVSKILSLIENASENKAKTENFITRFARVYTPAVVGAALLLAVVPSLITGSWGEWIYRALTFLVISCPCALVISVPLSFFGGIGGASKAGILVKGANYLEVLSNVKTVIFDKTGTLTEGSFSVTKVIPENVTEKELLFLTAAAESFSTHPIARSLIEAYGETPDKNRISSVSEIAGHGVSAVVDGKNILAGNGRLMEQQGISYTPCNEAGTIVYAARDGKFIGTVIISDKVKENSAAAIKALKECGVEKTVMLTGDTKSTGEYIAKQLGLDKVCCELLPADKVTITEELMSEGSVTAFAGDGVNDAPVITRADVGIAMGCVGSDAAIEAADIVIMDDDPAKIAKAVKISRKTLKIVKQNIIFSLAVKAIVLILGALGFAGMWAAVFADVGVSVIAILNAMRSLKTKNV